MIKYLGGWTMNNVLEKPKKKQAILLMILVTTISFMMLTACETIREIVQPKPKPLIIETYCSAYVDIDYYCPDPIVEHDELTSCTGGKPASEVDYFADTPETVTDIKISNAVYAKICPGS